MNKAEYELFWHELTHAETAPVKNFEKAIFFEGCMPVEEMASRGIDTLRFGPLKPVGLENPTTGERPYAVIQLRQDNFAATLYNIVGFQTHLKWPEQERVFRLIPGLEKADFVRLGVMHRNTFINSPKILSTTLQMITNSNIFFAGQITGVEGYVESAASGLVAGLNASRLLSGLGPVVFPKETAHGALCHYITNAEVKHFQPMNINFGLLPPWEERIRDKKIKNHLIAQRSLIAIDKFKEELYNNLA
jgi:methylenetetrahydrofolate--tRNA-(uracil-5-)-methyltransferase